MSTFYTSDDSPIDRPPSDEGEKPGDSAEPRSVRVRYFARLREERGRSEERIETRAPTVAAFFDELVERFGIRLNRADLRVAVNDAFCGWERPIGEDDLVVFIPPVSGG